MRLAPRSEIPGWASAYIGIPYNEAGKTRADGVHCWNLLALALREQFNFDIDDYDGPLFHGRYDAAAVGAAAAEFAHRFTPLQTGDDWRGGCHDERAGDGILLRMLGVPLHVGLVVAPGWMLHIERSCDSVIEPYSSSAWRDRVLGFYRANLPGAAP